MSEAPTLELQGAAVRRAGAAPEPALSLRTGAQRVGLLGDWQPLLQTLTGLAELATGTARVLDCELEMALARGVLGFAACDPLLPASFTVTQYLQHAARLSHGSAARAVHDVKRALDRYGLGECASRKLSRLAQFQQRALGIALSTLTSPPAVCLEAPLRDLDAPSAEYVARLCVEAAAHGRLIITAPWPSSAGPERALLDTCDELFVIERGVLVAQGAPALVFAPNGRYLLTVSGAKIAQFSAQLSESGCRLSPRTNPGDYLVELPASGSTDLLLDAALDQGLVVLELEPLFGAP